MGNPSSQRITVDKRLPRTPVFGTLLLVLLSGLGLVLYWRHPFGPSAHEIEVAQQQQEQHRAEAQLFSDPDRAAAEIERRLRSRVTVHNAIAYLSEPGAITEWNALPTTSGWTVTCNQVGLFVTLPVGGEDAGSIDLTDVKASGTLLTSEQCRSLTALAAEKIQAIMEGR